MPSGSPSGKPTAVDLAVVLTFPDFGEEMLTGATKTKFDSALREKIAGVTSDSSIDGNIKYMPGSVIATITFFKAVDASTVRAARATIVDAVTNTFSAALADSTTKVIATAPPTKQPTKDDYPKDPNAAAAQATEGEKSDDSTMIIIAVAVVVVVMAIAVAVMLMRRGDEPVATRGGEHVTPSFTNPMYDSGPNSNPTYATADGTSGYQDINPDGANAGAAGGYMDVDPLGASRGYMDVDPSAQTAHNPYMDVAPGPAGEDFEEEV